MNYNQLLSIIVETESTDSFIEYISDSTGEASLINHLADWFDLYLSNFSELEHIFALMEHTGDVFDDAANLIDSSSYLVLTDSEADDAWEEALDNYLDDCVLPELTESAQTYFDRDSWKSGARYDGRGHALATYDGNEHEQTINGTTYFIYRT